MKCSAVMLIAVVYSSIWMGLVFVCKVIVIMASMIFIVNLHGLIDFCINWRDGCVFTAVCFH